MLGTVILDIMTNSRAYIIDVFPEIEDPKYLLLVLEVFEETCKLFAEVVFAFVFFSCYKYYSEEKVPQLTTIS